MDPEARRSLARAPYGPWRRLTPGEASVAKPPLIPGVMGELYPIYAAAGSRNVTARGVDLLEIWEVAAMFGVGLDDGETDPASMVGGKRFSEGGLDPNVINRAKRAMGYDAPDVEIRSYHPEFGVL